MHGWADGLGELGEGMCALAGAAFLADFCATPERSRRENRVMVATGQGLVPAGSWVTVPNLLRFLHGFSKAAQPAVSPAASHPDLSGWPCQGTSVLTCGNWPPACLCQDISEQTPHPACSFQHLPKTSF